MASVTYDRATRQYSGSDQPAVDELRLQIEDGEFLVLVGPSGCGKSTSLRMLAGLEDVDSGTISIGDTDVTGMQPKDRDVAMVFQNYALYPHMTVGQNMGFSLKIARTPKSVIQQKVAEAARLLDLERYLDRKPKALSGGQRQRVAMGRAIVREPRVFLMDEPLSNLDAKLRVETRASIAALQRRLRTTTVYVTHDQVEAMTMGDRVAVLRDGVLQQCDPPPTLYDRPANVFVAGFMGSPSMNLLTLPVTERGVELGNAVVPISSRARAEIAADGTSTVVLGLRPENLIPVAGGVGGELAVRVTLVEELGADAYVHGTVALGDEEHSIVLRTEGRNTPRTASTVHVSVDPGSVHLFSSVTGRRLVD